MVCYVMLCYVMLCYVWYVCMYVCIYICRYGYRKLYTPVTWAAQVKSKSSFGDVKPVSPEVRDGLRRKAMDFFSTEKHRKKTWIVWFTFGIKKELKMPRDGAAEMWTAWSVIWCVPRSGLAQIKLCLPETFAILDQDGGQLIGCFVNLAW